MHVCIVSKNTCALCIVSHCINIVPYTIHTPPTTGTAAATNNTPKAAAKTAKTNKKTTNGVAVKNKGSNTATKGSNNTAVPSRKRLRKAVSDAQQGDDVPVDVMDVDDVFSEEDEEEEVEGSSGDEGSDWEADAKVGFCDGGGVYVYVVVCTYIHVWCLLSFHGRMHIRTRMHAVSLTHACTSCAEHGCGGGRR